MQPFTDNSTRNVIKTLRRDKVNEIIPVERIAQKIYVIRGQRVILDSDMAKLYGVNVKRLNEQVKRNIERFPESYMFQLSAVEKEDLRSQIVTSSLKSQIATSSWGGARKLPYVFTEHGVVMLSSVLKSMEAIKMSFIIVEAFVRMRKLAETGKETSLKIREHDIKLLLHDKKLEEHENSINAVVGHLIGTAKKKKHEKKYGFKIDENNNIVKEEQNVALYS
jgi:hypothetical protein